MADIKEQKLLYHLTALSNLESILEKGLLPRSQLNSDYTDVAGQEIIDSRKSLKVEDYVPFHFFARNPFDGRVQKDHPKTDFILIAVRRTTAKRLGWMIIPCHPLANAEPALLAFDQGMDTIDWGKMNERDYYNDESKRVCMAECLSPGIVSIGNIWSIFVTDSTISRDVSLLCEKAGIRQTVNINVNPRMFLT